MIYGIGDLHLDSSKNKPMDIFGYKWIDHDKKIVENWSNIIKDEDLVLIPGDVSWALKIEESVDDLKMIDELPGRKIISKGNHDYWWESLSKLNKMELKSIQFLQNNSFIFRDTLIAGTRGWMSRDAEGFNDNDEKIFKRELNRLILSLSSSTAEVSKKIVMVHYPPFNTDLTPNEFVHIMKDFNVDICIYGHLHGEGHKYAVEGVINGIEFHCVSSDYIDFIPKKIL